MSKAESYISLSAPYTVNTKPYNKIARLLDSAAPWVRNQTSLKNYKIGDISKGVANTLELQKNIK
jgi:hypothetical protein